jgi:hypothetical protein
MSDKRKEQQEKGPSQTRTSFCAEMIEKMMGQEADGNPCVEMMSQCFSSKEIWAEASDKMSQVMATCCGPGEQSEADTHTA